MLMAKRVAKALRESGLRCEGVNLFLADGEAAGQEVPHVHLQVFPRFAEDGFGLRHPKRYFGELRPRAALDAAAADIRSVLLRLNPE
jgi:diadenosine tetraphosphate (Ap4A) HIT family hydrolase